MAALVMEFLFAVVFTRALASYLRRHDQVQRAVMLTFSAMAALFALDLVHRVVGPPPGIVLDIASVLIYLQPYLTLRLIALLRPVPRWLSRAALAGYLASVTPVLLLPSPVPKQVLLTAVSVYVMTGAIATGYLVAEARRRAGSPQARLWLASLGSGSMAIALSILGLGTVNRSWMPVTTVAGRAVALIAALAYLLAFTPPVYVRRLWSGGAAHTVSRRLLRAPVDEAPEVTWQRYVSIVRELAGADATALVAVSADDTIVELATSGVPAGALDAYRIEDLQRLLTAVQPVLMAGRTGGITVEYAGHRGARYARVVPVPLPSGRPAALLLINRYRSLFAEDDARVLADLGSQAAVLAERGEILAAREQLTAELEASVTALEAASQAKSDFLASMSHELRTPLNAIIGFSDLMRGEPAADGRRLVPAEWIENVLSSGQHLLRLINDILDIAKVEAGRLELNRQPVALHRAVGEVTATLRPLIERKHLRLETRVALLTLSVDPIRLRQILDNLLSNAIKFTPEGGRIDVEVSRDGDDVLLCVIDSGVGIALADQQLIFDEFQQVGEAAARMGGTGLGLALTRRLVQAHGGEVTVESSPGRGSRFTVRLPGPPSEQQPARPSSLHAESGLLVIEDDPVAANLLRTYLENAGYQVSVATTGEDGLALARAHRPEAILLDVHLPGIDGWEVLTAIREDPRLADVPAFMVTVIDEKLVGQALGATDYFVKPVDRHRLLSRLAEHVIRTSPATSRQRVLIVDDDPSWLEIMAADLRRTGAEVTTAQTAAQAYHLACSRTFDLVATDLRMPGSDGFSLVTSLQADPATQHIPVLVMTAFDVSEADRDRLEGKAIGIVGKDGHACEQLHGILDRIAGGMTQHGVGTLHREPMS
jgi:signal transduction histidine kinase/DNA-binding response OmpR family regulator